MSEQKLASSQDSAVWALFAANAPQHPNHNTINDTKVYTKLEVAEYQAKWRAMFADLMFAEYTRRFGPESHQNTGETK